MFGLNLSLPAVQAVAAVVCAALLLIQSRYGSINVVVALLLVPIFFVSVSVVSYLFGEGMYFWDRSRAGFVRYDSESRPFRAFLYFAFFTAATAFFVAVFFKLHSGGV